MLLHKRIVVFKPGVRAMTINGLYRRESAKYPSHTLRIFSEIRLQMPTLASVASSEKIKVTDSFPSAGPFHNHDHLICRIGWRQGLGIPLLADSDSEICDAMRLLMNILEGGRGNSVEFRVTRMRSFQSTPE